MIQCKCISASALLVGLAACETAEVKSPMPDVQSVIGEISYNCADGQKVTVIHEAIYGERVVGPDGKIADPGRESVQLAYKNRPLRFESEDTDLKGPWEPALENGFFLELDDKQLTLGEATGRILLRDCQREA